MTNKNDPTFYALKFLKVTGLDPESKSPFLYIFFAVNVCLICTILVLAVLGVIKENIFLALEALQTVFLYIHLLGKYPTIFLNRKVISKLLQQRAHFWRIEDFDAAIQKQCFQILKSTAKFLRNIIFVTFLVIMNFFWQPFVIHELPVRVYVPPGWYGYINGIFYYLIPTIMGGIYGSDLLFCAICVPIIVQFKLLSWKLEQLDYRKSPQVLEEDLRKIVDHQNFLIECCQITNKYNRMIFLNQIILSTAIICMEVFVVTQKGFSIPTKLKFLAYCPMEIFETAIYCLNAELLSEAAMNVGNSAYKSQWYETRSLSIRRSIILIIARSQRQIVFNGFGFVWVNLTTFTKIFKTSMSFLSYLNTMFSYEY